VSAVARKAIVRRPLASCSACKRLEEDLVWKVDDGGMAVDLGNGLASGGTWNHHVQMSAGRKLSLLVAGSAE
jgi:hypothetical protein